MRIDPAWRWQRPRKVNIFEKSEFRRGRNRSAHFEDKQNISADISGTGNLTWDFLGHQSVNPLKELPNGHRYYGQLYDQFRISAINTRSIGAAFFLRTGDLLDSGTTKVTDEHFDFCLSESAELWWVTKAMEALLNFGAPHTVSHKMGLISEIDVVNPMRIEDRTPFVEPYQFYPAEQARLIQMADAARDVRYWPTLNLTVPYSTLLHWLVMVINKKLAEYAMPQFEIAHGYRRGQLVSGSPGGQSLATQKMTWVTTPINLCGYFWLCAADELQSLGTKEYYRCSGFQKCAVWLSKKTGQRTKRLYCRPACRMADVRATFRALNQTN
jgi:hypothetical protein